ncbi:DUF6282 family protein [Rhodococcus sp. IEGM 1318]|uniref:DUF6282 family protein n=1 Tax=Rhodococcus sp. IEGM 1318 TaxID=3082226 RepID=UPI001E5A51C0|nr:MULTISPECIES: DUF6282 family protein [Rhodococcus]MCD2108563.1 DUF6282 family protein [Rhodococcus qingshengii]MCZ4527456.1 DUF6282 family protein [Rhodococcus erythropolis]MDV8008263.1 DUF6282 family protein [Rhodococcus sp. IEGM 1318]
MSAPVLVDLHVHAGPDLLLRRHSVIEAGRHAQRMGAWFVAKSHLGSTCESAWEARELGLPVSGSIVLNDVAGGVDPRAVERGVFAQGELCDARVIVFLPTMRSGHSSAGESFAHSGFTRARWSSATAFTAEGTVSRPTFDVLRCVRDHDLILATGHSSAEESLRIMDAAAAIGVERVLLTHATHPMSGFSVDHIAELAANPAIWVEVTALSVLMNRHPYERVIELANVHQRVVLSSDLGQPDRPDLPAGWQLASQWCAAEVFDRVSRVNPSRLLFR